MNKWLIFLLIFIIVLIVLTYDKDKGLDLTEDVKDFIYDDKKKKKMLKNQRDILKKKIETIQKDDTIDEVSKYLENVENEDLYEKQYTTKEILLQQTPEIIDTIPEQLIGPNARDVMQQLNISETDSVVIESERMNDLFINQGSVCVMPDKKKKGKKKINDNTINLSEIKKQIIMGSTYVEEKPEKKGWKNERRCREIVEKLFGKPFESVRPNFLKNTETCKNLELDMFNPDLMLAIEYNGEQHYKYPNGFHKTEEEFIQAIRRDKYKKEICETLNIYLLTIPYTINYDDLETYIINNLYQNFGEHFIRT